MREAINRYNNGDRTKTATKCYEENKKVLKENARNKYRNLLEKEKEVKKISKKIDRK